MANTSDIPTQPDASAAHAPGPSPAGPQAPAPGAARPPAAPLRSLSPRVTAALAGLMLAIGVATGAAIGPAPSTSFAGASRLPQLLPTLLAAGVGRQAPVQPPAVTPAPTPSPPAGSTPSTPAASSPAPAGAAPAPAAPSPPAESAPSSPSTPGSSQGASTVAPVTHVWLVELAGPTFASALAQPSLAPYISGTAVPAGTLLSGWSGLSAAAFAGEAAQLASPAPQLLQTVTQAPCPEGPAGAACASGTPGELTAADDFLKASIPAITSTPAYREHGLIVVTFGSVVAGSASGLPAGSSAVTLTALPAAGVLLVSPFAAAGARSSTPFNATSPKQSVERLLRR
jgi:hypothetical protein